MEMKLFMKQKIEEQSRGSSIPRISKMGTPELLDWFSVSVMGLGKSFDEWRYKEGPDEISSHLNVLTEIWKELRDRKEV